MSPALDLTCNVCQIIFKSRRAGAKTCSDECADLLESSVKQRVEVEAESGKAKCPSYDYEELKALVVQRGYLGAGRQLNVDRSTIKRWIKNHQLLLGKEETIEWDLAKNLAQKAKQTSYEELKKLITQYGYQGTGQRLGVHKSTLRRWVRDHQALLGIKETVAWDGVKRNNNLDQQSSSDSMMGA